MTHGNHTLAARIAAATFVAILAVVGLAATSAALSVSLRESAHACCHTEQVDLSCLTLCAASASDAVLIVADDPTPDVAVHLDEIRPERTLASDAGLRDDGLPTARSSPGLYVLHAAFLI